MEDHGRPTEGLGGQLCQMLDGTITHGSRVKGPGIDRHDFQAGIGEKPTKIQTQKSTATDHADAAKHAEIS